MLNGIFCLHLIPTRRPYTFCVIFGDDDLFFMSLHDIIPTWVKGPGSQFYFASRKWIKQHFSVVMTLYISRIDDFIEMIFQLFFNTISLCRYKNSFLTEIKRFNCDFTDQFCIVLAVVYFYVRKWNMIFFGFFIHAK